MNQKALSGVLMIAGAAALAWAYFAGHLDGTIAAFTAKASSTASAVKQTAAGSAGSQGMK
jgi:hypothetical protein